MFAQVDRADIRQLCAAVAAGQDQLAVGAALRLHQRFQRRSGGGQDRWKTFHFRAHHGHVAGVVENAVLLLEAGLVRLVDDDAAQVRVGQEQGRAGADGQPRLSPGDGAPGGSPLRGAQIAVPGRGAHAEARLDAAFERLRQRDFRQQDQHLSAVLQRRGNGLQVGFGLARAGNAVKEEGRKLAPVDRLHHLGGSSPLLRRKLWRRMGGIRHRRRRVCRSGNCLDGAGFHKSPDHRVRHLRPAGKFAHQPLAARQRGDRCFALRRHALRDLAGQAVLRDRAGAVERGRRGDRHAHHRGERRIIIAADPLAQAAQAFGQRRRIVDGVHLAQLGSVHFLCRQPLGLPDHAGNFARAEGDANDAARRRFQLSPAVHNRAPPAPRSASERAGGAARRFECRSVSRARRNISSGPLAIQPLPR